MANQNDNLEASSPSAHWSERAAEELIRRHPDKSPIVCAAGISPSGFVHIGNFREVITVDFVVRALRLKGREVRFIYSWDDYDAFRKVPKNLPDPKAMETHLRKPISSTPDPFGEQDSYAGHFEKRFEKEVAPLGIDPEYIYQNKAYKSGAYNEGIRTALANQDKIIAILNKSRTQPLPDSWTCVTLFCPDCEKDTTKINEYRAPNTFEFFCHTCKQEKTLDMENQGGAKLLWRVDWPMRWAKEGVDFEPGGKDHSSTGGSYETGMQIAREVWKQEPPYYVQYDFVMVKGLGGKISSSTGQTITLSEALEVYEPAVLRWLFASRKPNMDFSIAFDLDVLKAYDDFDRTERFAFGQEEGDEKKLSYERRIYELSVPFVKDIPDEMPSQIPFRHLCNILQIHQGDLEKTKSFFADQVKTSFEQSRYQDRAKCAWNWIQKFAPDAFRFALRSEDNPPPKTQYPEAVQQLVALMQKGDLGDEDKLASDIFAIIKGNGLAPKNFFQEVYKILVDKPNGPRLASFLLAIGPSKANRLLERSL